VVFPFGHGLSYTDFSYSGLSVSSSTISACDKFELTVTVTNTGKTDGDEVVQIYAKLPDATVPTTRVRLVGFDRVHVAAGQAAKVTVSIDPNAYAVVHNSSDPYSDTRYIEQGKLVLFAGGGQPDSYAGALNTTVSVTGPSKLLSSC
jgi:beta-glucosidase